MDSLPDITNDRIGGYRILRRLATGGTSDVLLARAEGPHGFGRTVVLKKLLAQYQSDPQFERMFAREAAAYARLSHPSIVKLYDFFSLEGQLVMVIEFVDGLPLNRLRAMLRGVGHSLDDRAAIYVAGRVFAALSAAHAARDTETGEFAPVIHRDVNPSNVLIPWDGHVKLADFGIAKVAGMHSETQHGLIKGTYGYMAPEQVKGDPLTVRADVYAGALMLWELLARRKAIQRGALPEMEVLRAMAEPHIVSLDILRPDVDPQVRDAVRRGLEPVADKRAITADEMLNVLKASVKSEQGRQALVNAMSMVRPTPASDVMAPTESTPGGTVGQAFGENTTADARSPLAPPNDNDVEELARAVVALPPRASGSAPPPRAPLPSSHTGSHGGARGTLRQTSPPPTLASSEPSGRGAAVAALKPKATLPLRPGPQTARLGQSTPRPADSPATAFGNTAPLSTLRFEKVEKLLQSQPDAHLAPTAPPEVGMYPTTLTGTGSFGANGAASPPSQARQSQSSVPPARYNTVQASPPPPAPPAPEPWPLARSGAPPPDANQSTHPAPLGPAPSFDTTVASPAWPPSAAPPPPSNLAPPIEPIGWLPTEPAGYPATQQQQQQQQGQVQGNGSVHPQSMPPGNPSQGPPRWQSQHPEAPLLQPPPAAGDGRPRALLIVAVVLLLSSGGIAGGLAWKRARSAKTSAALTATSATSAATTKASATAPRGTAATATTTTATATTPSATPSAAVASATPLATASTPAATIAAASAVPAPSAPPAASAATPIAPVVAAAKASPAPSAKVATAGTPPAGAGGEMGDVKTDAASSGRRIFIDGRVAGQTPETVHVRCGPHTVRVGSSGKEQSIDVPCGGEIGVK